MIALCVREVFTHEFCDWLIDYCLNKGFVEGGVTLPSGNNVVDRSLKYRLDCVLHDDIPLCESIKTTLHEKMIPVVSEAFGVSPQRVERYAVGCYPVGGFFSRHNDNSQRAARHRNFEISLPLNTDFEGGQIVFHDVDIEVPRLHKGDALVYRAEVLHELLPVTSGLRYGFTSFLY